MPNIKCKYKFGDILYIRTDPEQRGHMLVGIIARPTGLLYELSFSGEVIEVYDFETSETKDPLVTMGIDQKDEDGG